MVERKKKAKMPARDPLIIPKPKRGIAVSAQGDRAYVYHVVRSYRNEKGRSKSETVIIGRLTNDGEQLITNANFDDLYYQEDGCWLRTDGKFRENE